MEILQVSENGSSVGGVNVKFNNGVREINYHLHTGIVTPLSFELRKAIRGFKGETISLEESQSLATADQSKLRAKQAKARIAKVNADLKSLGARTIKSIEDIPNAKAFIQLTRARIFEDNDGA